MLHLTIAPGAQVRLPWPEPLQRPGLRAVAVPARWAPSSARIGSGQLAVTAPGDVLTIGGSASPDSRTDAFDVLVLGGQTIGEPVAWHGPFVMNTRAELLAGLQDYEAGKLGVIPPGALGIR